MEFHKARLCAVLICGFLVSGCAIPDHTPHSQHAQIRNVILLIGDGMGPQQLGLLLQYGRYSKNLNQQHLNIERISHSGEFGLAQPSSFQSLVADSGCSTTALSSGVEALPQTLGLDAQGNRVGSILEHARDIGKSTGLISDTRATHATPAAFAVHIMDRNSENDIAPQMLESGVDVLLSGGLQHWIPKSAPLSTRNDDRNLLEEAKRNGYQLVANRTELDAASSPKLLGLFTPSGMPNGITESLTLDQKDRYIPTLAEMAKKALTTLDRNPRGFFLMVEAGQIDWAGHANDAGLLLHEMLRFDRTLGVLLDWMQGRDDTLLVVTADHETGGFGFSYSGYQIPTPRELGDSAEKTYSPQYNFIEPDILDKIYNQRMSLSDIMKSYGRIPVAQRTPSKLKDIIETNTEFKISVQQAQQMLELKPNRFYKRGHDKLKLPFFPYVHDFGANYPEFEMAQTALIARALAQEEGVVWSSGTHTSTPVPLIAVGPQNETKMFNGIHQQAQIGNLLKEVLLGN